MLKIEYGIKQLPTDKKIFELTRKENEITIFKKDLQALKKDIKAFSFGKLCFHVINSRRGSFPLDSMADFF